MNMNDGSANEENFFSPTVIVFYSNQVTIQSITKQVGASIFFTIVIMDIPQNTNKM